MIRKIPLDELSMLASQHSQFFLCTVALTICVSLSYLYQRRQFHREIHLLEEGLRALLSGQAASERIVAKSQILRRPLASLFMLNQKQKGRVSSFESTEQLLHLPQILSENVENLSEAAHILGNLLQSQTAPEGVAVCIAYREKENGPIEIQFSSGLPLRRVEPSMLSLFETLLDESLEGSSPVSWGYYRAAPMSLYDLSIFGVYSAQVVPIRRGSKPQGAIWLGFGSFEGNIQAKKRLFIDSLLEYAASAFLALRNVHEKIDSNRQERTLLLGISHDMRSPGNCALYAIRDLLFEHENSLSLEHKETLCLIESCISDQLDMIGDMLDYTKHQRGVLVSHPKSFDLYEELNQTCERFRSIAAKSGLFFNLEEYRHLTALFDPIHFRRILQNLLSNACKYTPTGGISIQIKEDENFLFVEVWDTGIGIPEEESVKLFSEFQRLNNSRDFRGNGLGLAICRILAQANRGKLTYKPSPNGGSIFSLCLPRATNIIKDRQSPSLLDKSILIVDDDEAACRMNARYLKNAVGQIHLAYSAEEAINYLSKTTPDLLITDFLLGAQTAIKILDVVSAQGKYIPILVLSGAGCCLNPSLLAEQYGAEIIQKPASRDTLIATLKRTLLSTDGDR